VYSPGELRELTCGLADDGYRWEIGCVKRGFLRLPITFLVGYPEKSPVMKAYKDSTIKTATSFGGWERNAEPPSQFDLRCGDRALPKMQEKQQIPRHSPA
jgi:hypothetical protein